MPNVSSRPLGPENLNCLKAEIVGNVSGTQNEPVLVNIIPGRTGRGKTFIFKIGKVINNVIS